MVRCFVLGVALLAAASAGAESSRFFHLEGVGSFLDGDAVTTAVSEDGEITLAPEVRTVLEDVSRTIVAAASWADRSSVVVWEDGSVERISRRGKRRALGEAGGVVTAAHAHADGSVWLGLAGPARLLRIDAKGARSEMAVPDVSYIWDFADAKRQGVLVATGGPGRILRIPAFGKAPKLVFESDQEHLRSVAYDKRVGVVAGGGSRGIVYRAAKLGAPVRALHDTKETEITDLVIAGGQIYAAAVSGAASILGDATAKVNSQFVSIGPDGHAEVLAGSDDEVVFALGARADGTILIATGGADTETPRGRIYGVQPETRRVFLLAQSATERLMWLLPAGEHLMAIGNAVAAVLEIQPGYRKSGEFRSEPFDASIMAQYGRLDLLGRFPAKTDGSIRVRTGQTAIPDDTWSPWSRSVGFPGGRVTTPPGRFVQMAFVLEGNGHTTPRIHRASLSYRRRNLAPVVTSVRALRPGIAKYPVYKPAQSASASDTKAASRKGNETASNGLKVRDRKVSRAGAQTIEWKASDPNGDALRYTLEARVVGGDTWIPMAEDLAQAFSTFEITRLPEGQYVFRVTASDAASNPLGEARTTSRTSRVVALDRTAPAVTKFSASRRSGRVTVVAKVTEAVGPLVGARLSIDGAEPRPIRPEDGVLDGPSESFKVKLGRLASGEHTVTLWVTDAAGNVGTAGLVHRIP